METVAKFSWGELNFKERKKTPDIILRVGVV
jgi:hypothetical protein